MATDPALVCLQLGNALVSMRRLTGYLVMEERADAVETLEHSGAQIKVLPASSCLASHPSRVSASHILLSWCLAS